MLAINAGTRGPERLTAKGRGRERCVPALDVVKLLQLAPYNPTYVLNMEWMHLAQ